MTKLGNLVVKKGEQIQANHLMALAALGIEEIVFKKVPKIFFFCPELGFFKTKFSVKVRNFVLF